MSVSEARLAKGALLVESVIHCLDSLCTYRGRCACLPIMHSTALMYLPGTAILNTLCSVDVTYPDHVEPLHNLLFKAFGNWFLLNSIAAILIMKRS